MVVPNESFQKVFLQKNVFIFIYLNLLRELKFKKFRSLGSIFLEKIDPNMALHSKMVEKKNGLKLSFLGTLRPY